ncbi:hypothetical protein [Methylobacterium phyllostachyos]|uniref:hypothetical protein n=1 Tax=Methylobacterium phyllostachyos TaxID=582672 RepID=UPI00115FA7C5|nr:hypothetical protein [Methylobacterium phyllostachyos]
MSFVETGPYRSNPALSAASQPENRVFYVYRGWNLGYRFATVGLNAIHFTRRAYARLTTGRDPAGNEMAVEITVPAGCEASADDVLAAFRRQIEPSD